MYKNPIKHAIESMMPMRKIKNPTHLAELSGVSQSLISRVMSGKHGTMSIENALLLAKCLEITVEQLMGDEPLPSNYVKETSQKSYVNVTEASEIKGRVPVISWVRAGELCEHGEVLRTEDAEEWRDCPVNHSDKSFVLRIVGDSMEPEYLDGTEIFVDPNIEARHNDDVIVCTPDGKTTFKRLQITPDGQYLLALNEHHPQRKIVVPEGTVICGVVIYSGKKRR